MPSSACPPWQTDKPARPAGERHDQPRSYTTSGDTIQLHSTSSCLMCPLVVIVHVTYPACVANRGIPGTVAVALARGGSLVVQNRCCQQSLGGSLPVGTKWHCRATPALPGSGLARVPSH